ncbi:MAG: hypothetical protein XXXJIFNMEKO3_01451 [Candidatus Erwinia impunctatus]|nr:hypothetical protein XXXJIFNMEKO_01451 [Culicoides impunctatus]
MAYHVKQSLEELIPLLEMIDTPWAIRDDHFLNVYMNKAALEYNTIPKGFDIAGRHDSEIPVGWSDFARQYQLQDEKLIDSRQPVSIIETYHWYGESHLTPYVCDKYPVYLEDNIIGTVWSSVPFKLFTPLEYVDNKPGKFLSSVPPTDIFTTAELRIAFFLINKNSAKQIARRLSLAERTIQNHIAALYQKADVSSLSQFLEYSSNIGLDCYLPAEFVFRGTKYI